MEGRTYPEVLAYMAAKQETLDRHLEALRARIETYEESK